MSKQFTRDTLKEIRDHILQKEAKHGVNFEGQTETERIISIAKGEGPTLGSLYSTQMSSSGSGEPPKQPWSFSAEQLANARAIQQGYKTSGGKQGGGNRPAPANMNPTRTSSSAQTQNVRPAAAAGSVARVVHRTPAASISSSNGNATPPLAPTAAPSASAAVLEMIKSMKGDIRRLEGYSDDQDKQIAKLDVAVGKMNTAVDKFKGSMDLEQTTKQLFGMKLTDGAAPMSATSDQNVQRFARLEAQIKQCQETIHDLDTETNEMLETMRVTKAEATATTDVCNSLKERVNSFETALNTITAEQERAAAEQKKLASAIKDLTEGNQMSIEAELKRLAKEQKIIATEQLGLVAELKEITAEQKSIEDEQKNLAEKHKDLASEYKKFGKLSNGVASPAAKSSIDEAEVQKLLTRITALEEESELRRQLGASTTVSPFIVTVEFANGELVEVQTFAKMLVNRLIERALRKKGDPRPAGKLATLEYLGERLGHTSCVGEWDVVEGSSLLFKWE